MNMKVPFVSFKPMEKELDRELRESFERVYTRSWYIEGVEDENFEKAFLLGYRCCDVNEYCGGRRNLHLYGLPVKCRYNISS